MLYFTRAWYNTIANCIYQFMQISWVRCHIPNNMLTVQSKGFSHELFEGYEKKLLYLPGPQIPRT